MAGWLLYSLYTPYLFMLILEASSFVTFSLLSELDFFFFFWPVFSSQTDLIKA